MRYIKAKSFIVSLVQRMVICFTLCKLSVSVISFIWWPFLNKSEERESVIIYRTGITKKVYMSQNNDVFVQFYSFMA